MHFAATESQKNALKALLHRLGTKLADIINKPMEGLTYEEADNIITMLENKEEYLCRAWLP